MEFLPYPHLITTLFNGCVFGPPPPFTAASTWTWIDHPVSGLPILTLALLRLGFPSAPHLECLTLPVQVTRRTVLQKVRGCTFTVLPQLVDTGFQVLFHSPPGVLFTFPSRYYSLSVTKSYLALRDGPRIFPPDYTCPVVLWIPTTRMSMPLTRLSLSLAGFSKPFNYQHSMICGSVTLLISLPKVWALPISLATTLGIVNLLSFPPVNEMFQFTGFPSIHYLIRVKILHLQCSEFPHSEIYGSTLICSSP